MRWIDLEVELGEVDYPLLGLGLETARTLAVIPVKNKTISQ
jgi:hypothetical protein